MEFITENIILIAVALGSGAMLLWPVINRARSGVSLDTLAATRLINDTGAVVLDIRTSAEYAGGHLPNARNIPLAELEKRLGELKSNKPVLICCASGARSGRALAVLEKAGRTDIYNLDGGLQAWSQAGLPVVK